METIENIIDNPTKFTLNDLLASVHFLLNNLDIRFNITKYITVVDRILLIPINETNWNIAHELFDIALLGCVMFVSDSDLFWAKWVYNKLLWKKHSLIINKNN